MSSFVSYEGERLGNLRPVKKGDETGDDIVSYLFQANGFESLQKLCRLDEDDILTIEGGPVEDMEITYEEFKADYVPDVIYTNPEALMIREASFPVGNRVPRKFLKTD